jgi:hypothetical protein
VGRPMQDAGNGFPRTPTFPDVGRLCVIVPLCTENWLRFSAVLHDVAPDVRFEKIV